MRFRLVRLRSLALQAIALGVAASCLTVASGPAGAAGQTARGADFQAPVVGECRMLNQRAVNESTDNTPTVDCAKKHTSRVIAVGRAPKGVTWKSDNPVLVRAVVNTCQPASDAALGKTAKVRDLTAYSWVWFIPTKAQRAKGARWIRCDLVLEGGGFKLRYLPTDAVPALGALPHPDEVARCLTGARFLTTPCARAHTFRATGAFTLKGIKGYPSAQQFARISTRRCRGLTDSDPYRWTFSGKLIWEQGNHTVVCYTETKK